ncbi:hypothetical protein [Microbacterium sp.]|uniref:hypothetical protein n=1 Tax=Microbacterium sp. TaxID=51671 RepID=UPI003F71FC10
MAEHTPRTDLEVGGNLHPTPLSWIIYFPWEKNPLPMNGSRGGHRAHARKVRDIRTITGYSIRKAGIPALGRCEAQLVWWIDIPRRRDRDNLGQLEKPMFDALVDAGVVTDDTPDFMVKPRADIRHWHKADGLLTGPGFTFHVRGLDQAEEF